MCDFQSVTCAKNWMSCAIEFVDLQVCRIISIWWIIFVMFIYVCVLEMETKYLHTMNWFFIKMLHVHTEWKRLKYALYYLCDSLVSVQLLLTGGARHAAVLVILFRRELLKCCTNYSTVTVIKAYKTDWIKLCHKTQCVLKTVSGIVGGFVTVCVCVCLCSCVCVNLVSCQEHLLCCMRRTSPIQKLHSWLWWFHASHSCVYKSCIISRALSLLHAQNIASPKTSQLTMMVPWKVPYWALNPAFFPLIWLLCFSVECTMIGSDSAFK